MAVYTHSYSSVGAGASSSVALNGGSEATATSVTFTPEASARYAVFWRVTNSGSALGNVAAKLKIDGTNYQIQQWTPKDSTDRIPFGGVMLWTAGGSPSSTTFAIHYGPASGSTSNTYSDARLLVLKLESVDEAASDTGDDATTSSTYSDKVSLNFTPGSTGDYLIIASAVIVDGGGNDQNQARIYDGTTAYQLFQNTAGASFGSEVMYVGIVKATSLSGAQTWKLQQASANNSSSCTIRDGTVIALRLDNFTQSFFTNSDARDTTTSTSEVNKSTLTQTPTAASYGLVIFNATTDGSSTTISSLVDFEKDGTSYQNRRISLEANASSDDHVVFWFEREALVNSSTSWTLDYLSETGSNTTGIAYASIALLDLGETAQTFQGGMIRSGGVIPTSA